MTSFIAICALLTVLAVALLAWPLLRTADPDRRAVPRANVAATLVAALLPLLAFAVYFQASDWPWDDPGATAPPAAASLPQLIAQLRQRLQDRPQDIEGWKLLGRSAAVTGDFPLAREAFGQALAISEGRDPDALVGFAESLVAIDESAIDGQAAELFESALQLAPDNARALWYGGIIAFRRGDVALAQRRWVELQNHDLPPDLRQIVAERLASIETVQGRAPADGPAAPAGIEISIGLAPDLAARVPAAATLFVIARRGNAGPPLAVVRRPVGSWPVRLTMTDADAMLPGVTLRGGGPLQLIARISQSGQPVAASGDLSGEVGYDFGSAHPARITIDRIVP